MDWLTDEHKEYVVNLVATDLSDACLKIKDRFPDLSDDRCMVLGMNWLGGAFKDYASKPIRPSNRFLEE